MKNLALLTIVLTALVLLIGCKKIPKGIPDLQPCSLTVTMDGQPLADAVVALVPEGSQTWYVCGKTDVSGISVMMTNGQYEGVPEGKFKVTVEKMAGDPNWNPKTDEERERGQILKSLVDASFAEASKTSLECTVVKGKNKFNFDVKAAK